MATPVAHPPTIDPVAAQHWARRARGQTPWLHQEVARRMANRLEWIQLPVRRWAHWEPAGDATLAHRVVAARYPDAERVDVLAMAPPAVQASADAPTLGPWWRRLPWGGQGRAERHAPVVAQPEDNSVQLIWANMQAHHASQPFHLMTHWLDALAPDGFLMFSCFGPDTLQQLRGLYRSLGWPPPVQDFTDMHDWGDQMVLAGFADPVMDMEHITLTFDSPARLLRELRELGRNLHPDRIAGLRTPRWRADLERAIDQRLREPADQPIEITFEIIYGHALKPRKPSGIRREPITIHRRRDASDSSSLPD